MSVTLLLWNACMVITWRRLSLSIKTNSWRKKINFRDFKIYCTYYYCMYSTASEFLTLFSMSTILYGYLNSWTLPYQRGYLIRGKGGTIYIYCTTTCIIYASVLPPCWLSHPSLSKGLLWQGRPPRTEQKSYGDWRIALY